MLLGLDIATRLTGWCAGDGSQVPDCGAWEFPSLEPDDLGGLGTRLHAYLEICWDRFRPSLVVYEKPIVLHGSVDENGKTTRRDNLPFLRKRYGMDFYIETFFEARGAVVREVTIQAIKKEVTGNHQAKKASLVAVALKCGLDLPTPGADDAADAFGAWLLALRSTNRALSSQWDRRIYSPRGALL